MIILNITIYSGLSTLTLFFPGHVIELTQGEALLGLRRTVRRARHTCQPQSRTAARPCESLP
eukprot:6309638-Pyramimonas_sp.AAC.1